MSNQAGIPLFNVPPIDAKTGQWSRPWLLFLQALWERTGGAFGMSTDDLTAGLSDDAGIEELKAQFFGLGDVLFTLPPSIPASANDDQSPPLILAAQPDDPSGRLEALEALVQRLQTDIEAIRQGQQL